MSVARPVVTVGTLTLASRVCGMGRDVLFAAVLGTGPVAEAFFVAFRLPNLFRRLFAEGAFAVAFVPIFARRLKTDGEEAAQEFAADALSMLASVLLVLTLFAQFAMPWLVYALAWGFAERAETFTLTVVFSRIAFPYLFFISLVALFAGVLNALRRFAAAAAAPILLNASLIAALVLAAAADLPAGHAVSWAVPCAGVLQLGLVAWSARRAGLRLQLRRPRLTPGVVRLLKVALPAAIASGVYQINLVVGTLIASFFAGAVAWLQYADRLYQLPLGVVAVALSVVLLPDLASRLAGGDKQGARDSFCRSIEICLAIGLPAAIALAVIPTPVIGVLFERGAFGPDDTRETAQALFLFALGLPAFMLSKLYAASFFAREDTRRPLRYACVAFSVNTVLAVAGAFEFGYLAVPAATSLSAWLMLALLAVGSRHFAEIRPDAALRRRAPRAALAGIAMGAALWAIEAALGESLREPLVRYGALAALVGGGFLVYAGLGLGIGAFNAAAIRSALRRRPTGVSLHAQEP